MSGRFRLLGAIGAAAAFSACSSSFERDWKAPQSGTGAYAGKWEGVWTSAKHRNSGGRLRCILTEKSPTSYHARFKANWMIFSSAYATDFSVTHRRGGIEFTGQENLGPVFGGVYTFKGQATPRHFTASYDSSYDRGTFDLQRILAVPLPRE